jgi:hypothetical protein
MEIWSDLNMDTQPIGPFLGINNRLPDFALGQENGRYLRSAVNVNINNIGHVVRRKAISLVHSVVGAHSLYTGLLVRSSALYAVSLPTYSETLVKALASNSPVSYCEFNGDIYYSNGTDSGRVASNGTWYPWALPTPATPLCASIAGTLTKGTYQVAVSYRNNTTGEESGVSASTAHALAADGGIRVTLPAATTGATHVNVYVSTLNGSVPLLHSTVATGTATVDLTTAPTGREANQRYEAPLPAGSRIFMFNGRLCSVKGNDLFYGIPSRPGYYLPSEGRIPFPVDISIAIGNQNGCYVASDKTYFLVGQDLGAVEIVRDVFPYGAVPGTEFVTVDKSIIGWFGEKGVVLADEQGQASEVMSASIDLIPPASGISAILQSGGINRVVSCGWCVNLDTKAVTSYEGWDFTSVYGEYGTKADGVYSLESTGSVEAHISLGKENFGAENLKRMPAAYLGVSSESPMMLRVITPEGYEYDYDARDSDTNMRIQRVDVGRGLRENWFGIEIHNTEGSDFTLASVSFAPVASGRRI